MRPRRRMMRIRRPRLPKGLRRHQGRQIGIARVQNGMAAFGLGIHRIRRGPAGPQPGIRLGGRGRRHPRALRAAGTAAAAIRFPRRPARRSGPRHRLQPVKHFRRATVRPGRQGRMPHRVRRVQGLDGRRTRDLGRMFRGRRGRSGRLHRRRSRFHRRNRNRLEQIGKFLRLESERQPLRRGRRSQLLRRLLRRLPRRFHRGVGFAVRAGVTGRVAGLRSLGLRRMAGHLRDVDDFPGEKHVRIFQMRIGLDQSGKGNAPGLGQLPERIALLDLVLVDQLGPRLGRRRDFDLHARMDHVRILDLRVGFDQLIQGYAVLLGDAPQRFPFLDHMEFHAVPS